MAIKWVPGKDRKTEWGVAPDYKPVDVGPKPTYDGAVLSTDRRSVQVMSDIWEYQSFAKVWDGDRTTEIYYGGEATVEIDATPDVLAKVAAYDAKVADELRKRTIERDIDKRVAYALRPDVGKEALVVRGRKVKIGTTGRIFWFGDTKYGSRVGLELPNGSRVFTATSNIEVSNPDDYLDVPALIALQAS